MIGNTFAALGVVVGSLLLSSLYCVVLLIVGLTAMRGIGLSRAALTDWPVAGYLGVAFAFGSGLFASLALVLATFGVMHAIILSFLLAAALVAGATVVRGDLIESLLELRGFARSVLQLPVLWLMLAFGLFVLLAMLAVAAFHPATGDGLAFYLPWSRVIASSGQVQRLPGYDSFSDNWTIAEIHIAVLMSVASDFSARLLPFWHAIATMPLLFAFVRFVREGVDDIQAGIVASIMLFTSSAVVFLLWDGKTDAVALPIGVAAIYVAAQYRRGQGARVAVLIGALAGLAVAAKLSYVVVLLATMSVLMIWKIIQRSRGDGFSAKREAALLVVPAISAVIFLLPQVLRNWVVSNEPLAPLIYWGFYFPWLEQTWFSQETTRRLLMTYPFALTFGTYWGQYGTLSVLVLSLLPACFLVKAKRSGAFFALAIALIAGIGLWMVVRPSTFAPRYILCVLVAPMSLVAVATLQVWRERNGLVRVSIIAAISYVLISTILGLVPVARVAVAYAGAGSIENSSTDESFGVARALNPVAAGGARIATLNYYRYPLRADLLACALKNHELHNNSPFPQLEYFYRRGAGYVSFDTNTHRGPMDQMLLLRPDWLDLQEVFKGAHMIVYRLSAAANAPKPEVACVSDGKVWKVTELPR